MRTLLLRAELMSPHPSLLMGVCWKVSLDSDTGGFTTNDNVRTRR